jgi:hypothetical protein
MIHLLLALLLLGQEGAPAPPPNPPFSLPAIPAGKGTWSLQQNGTDTLRSGVVITTLWEFYTEPSAQTRCGEVIEGTDSNDNVRYVILINGHPYAPLWYYQRNNAESRVQQLCDQGVK